MSREPRNFQLTTRIPKRFHKALKAQAATERRTVTDVVNNLIEAHVPNIPPRSPRR